MNEHDAMEVVNGAVANTLSAQAIFFTVLSAYLAVAYTIGNKLTKYQVAFVNMLFLIAFFNLTANQLTLMESTIYYVQLAIEARGAIEASISGVSPKMNMLMFFSIRFLMLVGAILFMWQVRHPKTE